MDDNFSAISFSFSLLMSKATVETSSSKSKSARRREDTFPFCPKRSHAPTVD